MEILDKINKYLEDKQEDSRRPHLGASIIGDECSRKIWYSFRWALTQRHEGRMLRLFDRGHKEELRIVEWLNGAGYKVKEFSDDGLQFNVKTLNGVFGGSLDGIIFHENKWKLLEFKTYNKKSFTELKSKGVKEKNICHYDQMQTYMHLFNENNIRLSSAIYIAICKDDDEIYIEEVKYDVIYAKNIVAKAKEIIDSDVPPQGISNNPSFYKCKFCDFSDICHYGKLSEVNCRTCIHFEAKNGFVCEKYDYAPTTEEQKVGCKDHLYIPSLIPLKQIDVESDTVIYENGLRNGPNGFSSKKIYKLGIDIDRNLEEIIEKTNGEIV